MSFILTEDGALNAYLRGMTVSDEGSSLRPVKVYFGVPDTETGSQEYPYVTISLIDVAYASYRKMRGGKYKTTEVHGNEIPPLPGQIMVRDHPEPYDLSYQVTSFSRHPRHDRMLLAQLNRKIPGNNGVMPILETAGDLEQIYRPIFLDGFTKRDSVEGTGREARRLFRNIYTIRVPTELDPDEVESTFLVLNPRLNVDTSHIPTGYDKP